VARRENARVMDKDRKKAFRGKDRTDRREESSGHVCRECWCQTRAGRGMHGGSQTAGLKDCQQGKGECEKLLRNGRCVSYCAG